MALPNAVVQQLSIDSGFSDAQLRALTAIFEQYEPASKDRVVNLTADSAAVNNSTTLVDTGLEFTVEAGKFYEVEATLIGLSGTTADWKFGWVLPSGTFVRFQEVGTADGTARIQSSPSALVVAGTADDQIIRIVATVEVGSTAGTVELQFAQNALQVADTQLYEGSNLKIRELSQ